MKREIKGGGGGGRTSVSQQHQVADVDNGPSEKT